MMIPSRRVWYGNETWMGLGGPGLFAAFPLVDSNSFISTVLPIIFMVVALIFRGVAFEFRFKATAPSTSGYSAFIWVSILSSFFQGVILGAYIQGIQTTNGIYSGG